MSFEIDDPREPDIIATFLKGVGLLLIDIVMSYLNTEKVEEPVYELYK